MKFICVLSVNGTLASYSVASESEHTYKAVLRNNNQRQDDLPAQFLLTRTSTGWVGEPQHPVIVPAIAHAIEESS